MISLVFSILFLKTGFFTTAHGTFRADSETFGIQGSKLKNVLRPKSS